MTEEKLTALQKAQQAQKAQRAAGIVPVRLSPIEKHEKNPTSLRFAINAKCFDCVGQDSDGGPRKRIGTCPVTKCPLHTVRPYQHMVAGDDDEAGDDE